MERKTYLRNGEFASLAIKGCAIIFIVARAWTQFIGQVDLALLDVELFLLVARTLVERVKRARDWYDSSFSYQHLRTQLQALTHG